MTVPPNTHTHTHRHTGRTLYTWHLNVHLSLFYINADIGYSFQHTQELIIEAAWIRPLSIVS